MNKTLKKTITAIILAILVLPVSIANAQGSDEINDPSDITCQLLNQSAETKGLVVTITEEEIGGGAAEQDIGDSRILRCFRVTTCAEGSQETGSAAIESCTKRSEYASSCTPGSDTLCQRVQVIISKTGPALLYTYIGMVYRWAAGIVGIVCVLVLIIGGIQVATAGDDQGRIGEAKTRIFQSIAGLVLLFLSALILYTINPNFFVI